MQDPILRRLFTDVIQAGASTGSTTGGRPLSAYPPEVQRRLSSLWAANPCSLPSEGQEPAGDPERDEPIQRIVEDCLARIARQREAGQRQQFRQALAAADRGGDQAQLLRLLSEHPSIKRGQGNS